jgi:hypothetical protein
MRNITSSADIYHIIKKVDNEFSFGGEMFLSRQWLRPD